MAHRRTSPRPLGAALDDVRGRWQPQSPLGQAQTAWGEVVRAWGEVVGAHGRYVVDRARPSTLTGGVLTVICSESVVAATLELQQDDLLGRLNAQLDHGGLTRLRCVTGELPT